MDDTSWWMQNKVNSMKYCDKYRYKRKNMIKVDVGKEITIKY